MLLVTGGAGFIGSNVVAALNDAGRADVAVCDLLGHDGKWRNLAKRQLADIVPPAQLPAWLDGREVIAVFEDPQASKPSYLMWLEWRDGQISFIRDYKYVRYVIDDAELVLAPDAASPGETTARG